MEEGEARERGGRGEGEGRERGGRGEGEGRERGGRWDIKFSNSFIAAGMCWDVCIQK